MSPNSLGKLLKLALLPLSAAFIATMGCGGSMVASNGGTQSANTGPAFVVGTDAPAPLPSVVGVKIQLESIVLTNGTTKSNNLLVSPVTVDFARFNGLQGLVDMNDVQTGTYTGVTIGLGTSNEIDYLNTGAAPPTISMPDAHADDIDSKHHAEQPSYSQRHRRSACGPAHGSRSGAVDPDERR